MGQRGRKVKDVPVSRYQEYIAKVKELANQKFPAQCPRCGGMMILGYNDATCLQCGEYMCNDMAVMTMNTWPPQGEDWRK